MEQRILVQMADGRTPLPQWLGAHVFTGTVNGAETILKNSLPDVGSILCRLSQSSCYPKNCKLKRHRFGTVGSDQCRVIQVNVTSFQLQCHPGNNFEWMMLKEHTSARFEKRHKIVEKKTIPSYTQTDLNHHIVPPIKNLGENFGAFGAPAFLETRWQCPSTSVANDQQPALQSPGRRRHPRGLESWTMLGKTRKAYTPVN